MEVSPCAFAAWRFLSRCSGFSMTSYVWTLSPIMHLAHLDWQITATMFHARGLHACSRIQEVVRTLEFSPMP